MGLSVLVQFFLDSMPVLFSIESLFVFEEVLHQKMVGVPLKVRILVITWLTRKSWNFGQCFSPQASIGKLDFVFCYFFSISVVRRGLETYYSLCFGIGVRQVSVV